MGVLPLHFEERIEAAAEGRGGTPAAHLEAASIHIDGTLQTNLQELEEGYNWQRGRAELRNDSQSAAKLTAEKSSEQNDICIEAKNMYMDHEAAAPAFKAPRAP